MPEIYALLYEDVLKDEVGQCFHRLFQDIRPRWVWGLDHMTSLTHTLFNLFVVWRQSMIWSFKYFHISSNEYMALLWNTQ